MSDYDGGMDDIDDNDEWSDWKLPWSQRVDQFLERWSWAVIIFALAYIIGHILVAAGR